MTGQDTVVPAFRQVCVRQKLEVNQRGWKEKQDRWPHASNRTARILQ